MTKAELKRALRANICVPEELLCTVYEEPRLQHIPMPYNNGPDRFQAQLRQAYKAAK